MQCYGSIEREVQQHLGKAVAPRVDLYVCGVIQKLKLPALCVASVYAEGVQRQPFHSSRIIFERVNVGSSRRRRR